jgi:hypothetical protein
LGAGAGAFAGRSMKIFCGSTGGRCASRAPCPLGRRIRAVTGVPRIHVRVTGVQLSRLRLRVHVTRACHLVSLMGTASRAYRCTAVRATCNRLLPSAAKASIAAFAGISRLRSFLDHRLRESSARLEAPERGRAGVSVPGRVRTCPAKCYRAIRAQGRHGPACRRCVAVRLPSGESWRH